MNKLTQKQNTILGYITEYIENKRENPTSYKLHKYIENQGINESMKSVMQVIEALEKKELITRDESKKIYAVENSNYANTQHFFSIPLYGLASCGEALAYADDTVDDFLQLSKSLFYPKAEPQKLFAVKALGDSMNKANINDGDYVIFEKIEEGGAADLEGRIVVAVINGLATIKTYRKMGNGLIALFPNSTNPVHHPIYLSENDSIFVAGFFKKVLPVKFVSF